MPFDRKRPSRTLSSWWLRRRATSASAVSRRSLAARSSLAGDERASRCTQSCAETLAASASIPCLGNANPGDVAQASRVVQRFLHVFRDQLVVLSGMLESVGLQMAIVKETPPHKGSVPISSGRCPAHQRRQRGSGDGYDIPRVATAHGRRATTWAKCVRPSDIPTAEPTRGLPFARVSGAEAPG